MEQIIKPYILLWVWNESFENNFNPRKIQQNCILKQSHFQINEIHGVVDHITGNTRLI